MVGFVFRHLELYITSRLSGRLRKLKWRKVILKQWIWLCFVVVL